MRPTNQWELPTVNTHTSTYRTNLEGVSSCLPYTGSATYPAHRTLPALRNRTPTPKAPLGSSVKTASNHIAHPALESIPKARVMSALPSIETFNFSKSSAPPPLSAIKVPDSPLNSTRSQPSPLVAPVDAREVQYRRASYAAPSQKQRRSKPYPVGNATATSHACTASRQITKRQPQQPNREWASGLGDVTQPRHLPAILPKSALQY